MSPTVLGKVVHDRPLSVGMIAQALEWSSCIMHLPAPYKCMPRGAERENGLSGESHTQDTNERRRTHGAGGGKKTNKTLKPQYDRWRMLSIREREEGQNKNREDQWWDRESEKKEQQRRRGGVSRLTGSPSVLGLPPPSVYRCPAETEGTTKLHTPPSPAVPTLPNTPFYIWHISS